MSKIYDQINARHLEFQQALADDPELVQLEAVQAFICQAREAGADVTDIEERAQLRKMLRHCGAFVHKQTGEYPMVQLTPASTSEDSKDVHPLILSFISLFSVLLLAVVMSVLQGNKLPLPCPPTSNPMTLCNGDFGNNSECWQHGGELVQNVVCKEDQCYAVLGSPNYDCSGDVPVGEAWIKRTFQVPQGISPKLLLNYRIFSYDLSFPHDYFQVVIDGEPSSQWYGNDEWKEPNCMREPWDSGWKTLKLDLSDYRDEVDILFRNVNSSQPFYNTWTYVCNVRIETAN